MAFGPMHGKGWELLFSLGQVPSLLFGDRWAKGGCEARRNGWVGSVLGRDGDWEVGQPQKGPVTGQQRAGLGYSGQKEIERGSTSSLQLLEG